MKAAILTGYDKNGRMLEIRDIPMPEIKDNDVLVKIHTAGVNPLDNMIIKGEVKMIVPYSFPLVMGNEFVGIVEKAASVPLTALTAMQALALMSPKKGETIFISGGTGSLGAMAIPVAKNYGLTVITNGNGASEERVRRLGADRFIKNMGSCTH